MSQDNFGRPELIRLVNRTDKNLNRLMFTHPKEDLARLRPGSLICIEAKIMFIVHRQCIYLPDKCEILWRVVNSFFIPYVDDAGELNYGMAFGAIALRDKPINFHICTVLSVLRGNSYSCLYVLFAGYGCFWIEVPNWN